VQAQRWPWWVRATMVRDLEARQARLWWALAGAMQAHTSRHIAGTSGTSATVQGTGA
jgi:hypothetical protein